MQDVASYERNLGPIVRDPSVLIENYCSYVDVYDLCEAAVLAVESDLPGHEVFYVASPDTIGGHPLEEIVRALLRRRGGSRSGRSRATDASAHSTREGRRLLGWEAEALVARLPGRRRAAEEARRAMVMRRLGSAGPEITTVGFGTWARRRAVEVRLGTRSTTTSPSPRSATRSRRGVNWIDTAPVYGLGHSEEVVGRAIEPFRAGEEVLVFTKCGRPLARGART